MNGCLLSLLLMLTGFVVSIEIGEQVLLLKQRNFSSNLLKHFLILSLLYKENNKTITLLVYFL